MSGSKYVNLKETLIVNRSTYTSVLWSATSLCDDLNKEMEKLENVGENYFKSVKLLENLTCYLRGIQTKITQSNTESTD